jgi:hypothetical protein
MNHNLFFILFLISLTVSGQTASFTSSPASNNNTITVCQGNTITYTNTSTGTNNNTNYNWTFQGGTPNTSNQIGPHTVTYNNAGNFTTTLSLGAGITSTVNIIVTNNVAPLAVLTMQNIGQYSSIVYNGATIFRKCGGSSIGNFSFTDPNMASNPAGTTYLINWGDNTTSTNPAANAPQWAHSYMGQGNYTLSYTVTFPGGCSTTTTYQVYVGNFAPAITLAGSGSSSCLPNNYSFTLGASTTPSIGTTFQIIYNDGSPTTILNGLSSNPQTINHVFSQTSCGTNSVIQQQTYTNAYVIYALAINGCNPQGTFAQLGPITVGASINAAISPNPNINAVGLNQAITFNDVSNHGANVSGGLCDSLFGRYWSISPNSGYTTSGTIGNPNGWLPNTAFGYDWTSWSNGSATLPVTWTVPGNYQVTLYLGNDCGMDSIVFPITVNNCNPNQLLIAPNPVSQSTCSGASTVPVIWNSNQPNTTTTWTLTPNPNVVGAISAGTGIIPGMMLTNTSNTPQNIVYTATSNSNGCQNYDTVLVTVNNPSSSTIDSVACAPFLLNGQTYNQSGTYSQTIPNVQGCDSSITLNLTINNLPTTPIITVDSNNVLSTFDEANCTYQWVFCNTGFAIAGETDTLYTPTTNGVYAVQATNDCGTSTSQCVTINNVSLSELGSLISVFPNPTFSEITVMSDQLSQEEYTIHDQMGRAVGSGILEGSTTLIDLGNLSKGVYILKIQGIIEPLVLIKE